jgi:hypothetical protein
MVAITTARHAHAGFGGYALVVPVGATLGAVSVYSVWRIVDPIFKRILNPSWKVSESVRNWCGGVIYAATIPWAVMSYLLADRISAALLRLIT